MRIRFVLISSLVVFLIPLLSTAQEAGRVVLSMDPALPEVGNDYTLEAHPFATGAGITSSSWIINGQRMPEFDNLDKITLTAQEGATTITSRIVLQDGTAIQASKTIRPMRVDFSVEAHTATPLFYKGASLPSSGSAFTVSAHVFESGQQKTGLSYLWSVNNKKSGSYAVLNDNTLTYVPSFEREVLIGVEVFNARNEKVAEDAISIPVVEPEINFYEHNPLRGILQVALHDPHIFVGDEMTVRAEGYYLSLNALENGDLLTQWKINGKDTNANTDPQEVTLQKEGNRGKATLSFSMTNLKNLLQKAQESFTITF